MGNANKKVEDMKSVILAFVALLVTPTFAQERETTVQSCYAKATMSAGRNSSIEQKHRVFDKFKACMNIYNYLPAGSLTTYNDDKISVDFFGQGIKPSSSFRGVFRYQVGTMIGECGLESLNLSFEFLGCTEPIKLTR